MPVALRLFRSDALQRQTRYGVTLRDPCLQPPRAPAVAAWSRPAIVTAQALLPCTDASVAAPGVRAQNVLYLSSLSVSRSSGVVCEGACMVVSGFPPLTSTLDTLAPPSSFSAACRL